MPVGRNELCPCGSGRKYKNCCIGKERGTPRGLIYLFAVIGCIAALGVGAAFVTAKKKERVPPPAPAAARPATPQPQPPGPAPAGKVWSAEHGHWHDAGPTKENPVQVVRRNIPQPPGPVPEGKVWSPEHGHWHTKKAK